MDPKIQNIHPQSMQILPASRSTYFFPDWDAKSLFWIRFQIRFLSSLMICFFGLICYSLLLIGALQENKANTTVMVASGHDTAHASSWASTARPTNLVGHVVPCPLFFYKGPARPTTRACACHAPAVSWAVPKKSPPTFFFLLSPHVQHT